MYNLVPRFATLVLLANLTMAGKLGRQSDYKNEMKRQALLEEISKDIEGNAIQKHRPFSRPLVAITHKPEPSYAHAAGSLLPLSCEGIGSPAPSVRWFRNDQPVFEYDLESHEALDTNVASLARITSTLLVKHTDSVDEYTCVIVAGAKTARASTVVYGKGGTEITERTRLLPLAPYIVVSYKIYMDTIGADITLPCHAKGHPKPEVTWFDNKGQRVEGNPRIKVLNSGALLLRGLRWSDMGEYSCRAGNRHGTDTATTFLYPAKTG